MPTRRGLGRFAGGVASSFADAIERRRQDRLNREQRAQQLTMAAFPTRLEQAQRVSSGQQSPEAFASVDKLLQDLVAQQGGQLPSFDIGPFKQAPQEMVTPQMKEITSAQGGPENVPDVNALLSEAFASTNGPEALMQGIKSFPQAVAAKRGGLESGLQAQEQRALDTSALQGRQQAELGLEYAPAQQASELRGKIGEATNPQLQQAQLKQASAIATMQAKLGQLYGPVQGTFMVADRPMAFQSRMGSFTVKQGQTGILFQDQSGNPIAWLPAFQPGDILGRAGVDFSTMSNPQKQAIGAPARSGSQSLEDKLREIDELQRLLKQE